jgi:hypothetical protein
MQIPNLSLTHTNTHVYTYTHTAYSYKHLEDGDYDGRYSNQTQ